MPPEGLAIVFGNELIGVDAQVMDECDGFVMVRAEGLVRQGDGLAGAGDGEEGATAFAPMARGGVSRFRWDGRLRGWGAARRLPWLLCHDRCNASSPALPSPSASNVVGGGRRRAAPQPRRRPPQQAPCPSSRPPRVVAEQACRHLACTARVGADVLALPAHTARPPADSDPSRPHMAGAHSRRKELFERGDLRVCAHLGGATAVGRGRKRTGRWRGGSWSWQQRGVDVI
eukprot:scaffold36285_cov119-Isochrysis_galbana.AAC.3